MMSSDPGGRAGSAALLLTVLAVLKPPVEIALGGLDAGAEVAGLVYVVLSAMVLLPMVLVAALRRSRPWMSVLVVLHVAIAVLYLRSLEQPSWKQDDPAADVSAVIGATLHGAAAAAGALAVVAWSRRPAT